MYTTDSDVPNSYLHLYVIIYTLTLRHAEHGHKLEQEREQCVQEWQAGQAQLDALQKALEEHQVLLADKVIVDISIWYGR